MLSLRSNLTLGKNRPDADMPPKDDGGQDWVRAIQEGENGSSPFPPAEIRNLARYSRVLLLQGPNGPFFARLRDVLNGLGAEVWKINFNGGDDFYYGRGNIIHFQHSMSEWEIFLRKYLAELHIQAIVVFGGSRRHHRIAARVARAVRVDFWVFEEGYIRPSYITLEKDGVNADSPMGRVSVSDIPLVPATARRRTFKHPFAKMGPVRFLVCRGHETITEITSYDRCNRDQEEQEPEGAEAVPR